MPVTPPRPVRPPSSWRVIAGFFAVVAAFQLIYGERIRWTTWRLSIQHNPSALEGYAWWSGRLDLPERQWDTAYVPQRGKAYNAYPPLLPIMSFFMTAPLPGRDDPAEIPTWLSWTLIAWPVPLAGFAAFHRITGHVGWSMIWTLAWIGGTTVAPCLYYACGAAIYPINHLLSQTGLMLIAFDLLGDRRIWPSLIGLLIAAWSRQLTLLFAVPIVLVAWRQAMPQRRRSLVMSAAGLGIIVGVPAGLNWAKFGSPLDNGYRYIYEGRHDDTARDVQEYGVWSAHFVPRNAWYMNCSPPSVSISNGDLNVCGQIDGTSMWMTTPLLALVWVAVRRWWGDPVRRDLMLASTLIIGALLCYHATGSVQAGYYRFALDFIPIWLAVGAATLSRHGWRAATLACSVWSVVYFRLLMR